MPAEPADADVVTLRRPPVRQATLVRSDVRHTFDVFVATMNVAFHLIAPRPTFVEDMTDAERAVMAEHAAYRQQLLADGVAVVFGPVLHPAGPYGLAVVEVADQEHVDRIIAADPAVRAGLKTQVHPMINAVVRPYAPA